MPELALLIDGNSIGHRAYHALPRLWTYRGEPNHAVYGFTSMLVKALGELRPRYGAIAWDTAAATYRHEAYAGYKATRGEAPSDMHPQFDRIRQVASGLGFASLAEDGFEADDLLATLADQAVARGFEAIVLSSDADVHQLVRPGVKVLMPTHAMSEAVLYDEAAVRERCGVAPALVPDLKALSGDSSDNIPGVPGIGRKTAARLLNELGGLDELLANVERLTPALRESVTTHAVQIVQSRHLTTLRRDAPVELDPSCCTVTPVDRERAAAFLREMSLGKLAERLPNEDGSLPAPPPRRKPAAKVDDRQLSLFQ
jgi:DNA polymerase-1